MIFFNENLVWNLVWNEISKNVDYQKLTNRENLMNEIKKTIKKIDENFTWEVISTFLFRFYSIEKKTRKILLLKTIVNNYFLIN